jgi:mono/diheme cytochrome c family protein
MIKRRIRSLVAVALVASLAGVVSFAQSGGEATYKAKCASCHGATGMADSGAGKSLKIKPVNDPDVKAMSEADMIKVTTDGKGKMPAYKGKLTDDQIKDAVAHYRSLAK